MNQHYGYIYLIKDHFTNKVYIGQSSRLNQKHINNYYGSGALIKLIPKHHLQKIILGFCDTIDELDEAEKLCIEFYHSNNSIYGYNLTKQRKSPTGYKCKESTKIKIGLANKGHKHSEKTKRIIKEKRKQQTFTQETCIKIGEAHKGKKYQKHTLQHGNKGKKHSVETRKKYSLAKTGNTYRHDHSMKQKLQV